MVDTVLGAAVTTFMRPVDPSEQRPRLFQVDPDRMDPLIDSLVHSLGFGGSYNIIVWNPKPLLKPGRSYGYRTGFSAAEMAVMAQDDAISDLIDELSVDEDAEAAAVRAVQGRPFVSAAPLSRAAAPQPLKAPADSRNVHARS